MHLSQEPCAPWDIKVVQEISNENQVVSRSKLRLERVARNRVMSLGNPRRPGVFFRYFQNVSPV